MKVQLFIPCYIDQLYPQTGQNTLKILQKVGCEFFYYRIVCLFFLSIFKIA